MIGYNPSTQGILVGHSVPILISDFLYRSVLNLDCDEQRQLHVIANAHYSQIFKIRK